MFRNATSFNRDLKGWNTSNVTNMEQVCFLCVYLWDLVYFVYI